MFSDRAFILIFSLIYILEPRLSLLLYLQETGRCPSEDSSESDRAASAVELVLAKTPLGLAPIARSAARRRRPSGRARCPSEVFLNGRGGVSSHIARACSSRARGRTALGVGVEV